MLLLSSFVASLDGFLIGFSLKLSKTKVSWFDFLLIFFINILLYSFVLNLYLFWNFHFVTKFISTILYLILAYFSYHNQGEMIESHHKKLSFWSCFLLALTHSLDGTLVSLGFVYAYAIWQIVLLFSFMSVFILGIGYYFAHLFPNPKKSHLISALLFLILAFLNQFF